MSFSAAGLGLAYSEKQDAILLTASLSAVAFWIVKAFWWAAGGRGGVGRVRLV